MKKGLIINEDVWPLIDDLEPGEKSSLLTALSTYYKGGEPPDMERIVKMVFNAIAIDNERFSKASRERLSAARAEAGRKGGIAKQNKQNIANEANGGKTSKKPQDKIREDIEESRVDILFPPEIDQDYVREAYRDFKAMRDRIRKPMTKRAEELILKDLAKLSGGDAVMAKRILEQSTKNSWQGVFPLKSKAGKEIDWEVV